MPRHGAPKGHKFNVTHGLALVRNQIKRRIERDRSYVDKRTHEGQDALRIQAGLVEDQGGLDAISTAQFIAIQELTNLYYLALMMDRSTKKYLDKNPQMKNPKALSKLFSYRQPVSNGIEKYLSLLGLNRQAPPEQDLDDYLREKYGNKDGGDEAAPEQGAEADLTSYHSKKLGDTPADGTLSHDLKCQHTDTLGDTPADAALPPVAKHNATDEHHEDGHDDNGE